VIEKYKSRYKKMQAAQLDKDGHHKVDVGAAVQGANCWRSRSDSSQAPARRRRCRSPSRTAPPTGDDLERVRAAERQLASFRNSYCSDRQEERCECAGETLAKRRIFFSTLPGLATSDRREMDLLSEHAAIWCRWRCRGAECSASR